VTPGREALGRSRGGLSTKIHLVADRRCRPIVRIITPGQHGDSPRFIPLMDAIRIQRRGTGRPRKRPVRAMADKAYSSRGNRRYLRRRGIKAVIPVKKDQQANRQKLGSCPWPCKSPHWWPVRGHRWWPAECPHLSLRLRVVAGMCALSGDLDGLSKPVEIAAQGASSVMKSSGEVMDIIAAYREVGTYRGAAVMCGTTHKTVKRIIERQDAGGKAPGRKGRGHNYDPVAELVAEKVAATSGRISAKRLLPLARTAGYSGSARNFRRLVAQAKKTWRRSNHRGRRPAVWTPGEMLVIDWGSTGGLHVFCAVLAWSRVRFVRFADNERAETTLAMLAECFETLGGVPKVVLADRMGCLKGGVVANKVIPTADYVRFATHYCFRPDFCEARDPESKGIVENLVGYAKRDLVVPHAPFEDLTAANVAARQWCAEVNAVAHSEVAAVPADRLEVERELLTALPSLRPGIGKPPATRKVDKLSCVRFGSARYSVPNRFIGMTVAVIESAGRLLVADLASGEVVADHAPVAPGEASVLDEHYGGPRNPPRRAARARTATEKAFLALGEVAEQWLTGSAASGNARLAGDLAELAALRAAHGDAALVAALERAVAFRRWRAADIRSILAAGAGTPQPRSAGEALVLELPAVPTRPLSAYKIGDVS
jgi:transposase